MLTILINVVGTKAMNSKDLIGNQVHFPLGGGRVLVWAFEPEHFAYIGTDKIKIPIPIDIVEHTMNTAGFHFCIPGLGFRKYERLVIFRSKLHEELPFSGEQDLLLPIPSVIMGGGGIDMGSEIDLLTWPIRILGKKKLGINKK